MLVFNPLSKRGFTWAAFKHVFQDWINPSSYQIVNDTLCIESIHAMGNVSIS